MVAAGLGTRSVVSAQPKRRLTDEGSVGVAEAVDGFDDQG